MKRHVPALLLLFLLAGFSSYAQSSQRFAYLTVNINKSHDKDEKKDYYVIDAEKENPQAAFIHALTPHSSKKGRNNDGHANQPYNYFKSIGEALTFLDRQGWQLLSVYNHIYTNVYERVRSEPVYYLRKEVSDTTASARTHHP